MENNNDLEEGQIVLCTVEKVAGTTVFVRIDGGTEGTITLSEIAPGRIRNLRDYVVPGKRIACKVLNIKNGYVNLSLRRVTGAEKKELLDREAKEKSYSAILKTVLGKEGSDVLIKKILEEKTVLEFFEEIKENPKSIEKFLKKEDSIKILQILESKKEKPKEIKQIVKLSTKSSDGMNVIKNILNESCNDSKCEVSYLAAGKYRITFTGEDFKVLKNTNNQTLESIEKLAKKNHCEFAVEKA